MLVSYFLMGLGGLVGDGGFGAFPFFQGSRAVIHGQGFGVACNSTATFWNGISGISFGYFFTNSHDTFGNFGWQGGLGWRCYFSTTVFTAIALLLLLLFVVVLVLDFVLVSL